MKFIIFIYCLFTFNYCFAQNEQQFGDSLFTYFSADEANWASWYISLKDYHKLIERQRMSRDIQDEFMLSINDSYPTQLETFSSSMKEMQGQYVVSDKSKNYYKLTNVKIEPLEDIKLVYFFRLYISYFWKKGEDKYVIEFQACYLNKQWHMMEPFQEYYE